MIDCRVESAAVILRRIELQAKRDNRDVQIPPQELLRLNEDGKLKALLVDVRDEADFNQFHLRYGRMTPTDELAGQSEPLSR